MWSCTLDVRKKESSRVVFILMALTSYLEIQGHFRMNLPITSQKQGAPTTYLSRRIESSMLTSDDSTHF
ncbi:predicted protein [Chaetoceros tenuissimus]|uniref:Uncharacterized protein n=1 Tax=Chaetoceros tenuissimus TaxID=426638 RepID=A0AAD3CWB3_9STRA|nr:predicted protein [Chaetoceros tenuissimus]